MDMLPGSGAVIQALRWVTSNSGSFTLMEVEFGAKTFKLNEEPRRKLSLRFTSIALVLTIVSQVNPRQVHFIADVDREGYYYAWRGEADTFTISLPLEGMGKGRIYLHFWEHLL